MTIYNITELHFLLADDGDHTQTDEVELDATYSMWFADKYPFHDEPGVSSGTDCYVMERAGDEVYVTIYRYFSE